MAGPISTKSGRLLPLRLTTIFFILGSLIETVASGISLLTLGRLLSGVGAGAAIVVGPILVSEVAPPRSRGFFGAFTQVMTNIGILFAQTLGYFFSRGTIWRYILAVGTFIGAFELFALLFVPERSEERRVGKECA